MQIASIVEDKSNKEFMQLIFYWGVSLAVMLIGPIFSLLFPSTAELTSPRFLFLYGSTLMAVSMLIGFSLKGHLPLPIWTAIVLMLIVLIGLPTIKFLFEN
ncbi:hypothetical protein B1209_17160 [Raoultella planticola]|nr:hypothetical protein B1209_17160 [Raoultella planticola]